MDIKSKTDSEILYEEIQHFRQWWIILLFVLTDVLMLFALWQQLVLKVPFGNKPASDPVLVFISIVVLLLSVFVIFFTRLETKVNSDGIYIRFIPFIFKERYYSWAEIKECYVRKYSPITEYGGWGIRFGIGGSGKAYNVSGNMGLQIEFLVGKKLLIGTKKPEELQTTISKVFNKPVA